MLNKNKKIPAPLRSDKIEIMKNPKSAPIRHDWKISKTELRTNPMNT